MNPLFHRFGPFAVIAGLTQHLKIRRPIRPSSRERDFVVNSRINYKKTDTAPTRTTLSFEQLVDVFYGVASFRFKSCCFSSSDVDRTYAGVGIIPSFARSTRSFRVAAVPVVTCVPAALLAPTRGRVSSGIVVPWAWLVGTIEWLTSGFGYGSGTGHSWIKPLSNGGVKC